jgi:hypothetical protein
MGIYENIFRSILQRLDLLRKREKKFHLLERTFWFVAAALVLLLTIVALESLFHFNSTPRLLLIGLLILFTTAGLVWSVGRPLYVFLFRPHEPDDVALALKIGQHFPQVQDRLADALQVYQKHQNNLEGYSLELADTSLLLVDQDLRNVNFSSVASSAPLKKALIVLLGGLFSFLMISAIFHSDLTRASYRLLHPLRHFSKNPDFSLSVTPGDAEILKGDNVVILAQVTGTPLSEITLALKESKADKFERHALSSKQNGTFTYTLENIKADTKYFVEAGAETSPEYTIIVVELPFVRNLQVKLTYPTYTKLGTQFLDENVGDVSALKGTQVEISLQANKPVNEAALIFSDSTTKTLRIAGQELSGNFMLRQPGSYVIHLVDNKGRASADPIEYRLSVLEDQHPFVQITFPGQDVDLGEDMLLPLTMEAEDDFGFSKLRIGYQILQGGANQGPLNFFDLELPKELDDKLLLNYTWELSKLNIFPEDVVSYFAEVVDNDRVSGPKSSKSLSYRVRFPSLTEIYEEVARGHEESFESLEEMYEQSKALKDELKDISQQMKREAELNWEEKQKVQESVQAQEEMSKQLEAVQQQLEEMISRMEQNDLVSLETLEKYRELQKLMEEMLTPELKEALRELQKSLEELDPEKMKEAMEKFAASQEEFLKGLERTLNLLKKLQIEQQLDEAVRRAQDLLRRQEELNQQVAESPDKQNSSKYAQEQQGIRNDTEKLSEHLEDLEKRMSEFPQMPQERIESAQNLAGEQGLQSQMQNATQQLQSGNMKGAQSSGQQISQNLQELVKTLQTAQSELSEEQKRQIEQALSRSSHDLLNLSKQQENLMQNTQEMDRNSPGMNEAANNQQDLLSALSRVTNQLYELSQNTFFVTPEIGRALGKSISGMQDALRNLEERNSGQSTRNQGEAMSGLNEAVKEIRNSLQSLSSASSAIGFQEMMQRLMGLSNQQQGINQQTSQLGESPGEGGLTMEEQAALGRLAAEQGAVKKSLEQLLKEAGNRSDLLGDLAKVGEEMEEVVKELQQQNVSRSTINRQQRILSRLLDAQRSMHNRDFSRQREAETGKQYQALSPRALPENLLSEKDRLKNELLKAMKEGYSKDYRELIRKYFEALAREQQNESINN